jgi:dephospho-CoA kinase
MLKVGITGGIGSGKTTVTRLFSLLGAPVFYADDEAKKIFYQQDVIAKLVNLFGDEILDDHGKPERSAVAKHVFGNSEKLAQLNAIIHPAVARRFDDWLSSQDFPYIIKEAAILIESGSYKQLDRLILVTSPHDLKVQRIQRRSALSHEEIESRMAAQLSDAEKAMYAQYFIINDEMQMLIPQVLKIHSELCSGN